MSVGKRDRHTGQITTGHEWNGIEELNTRVPRAVYIALGAAFVFSVFYWLLMPTWPLGKTYTKGLLGITQHSHIDADLKASATNMAEWNEKISKLDIADIEANPGMMNIVRETAHPIFVDNCAACHGADAKGGPGFPSLVEGTPIWGRDAETMMETIRVGINSPHDDSRTSQMLAFGRDGMLNRDEILHVTAFVQSLSNPQLAAGPEAEAVKAGSEIFTKNCASCHGAEGKGNHELGAPDLTDQHWIYGGDRQSIFTTIYGGREGHMPSWEARLNEVERKMLTLYLLDLAPKEK